MKLRKYVANATCKAKLKTYLYILFVISFIVIWSPVLVLIVAIFYIGMKLDELGTKLFRG